MRYSEIIAFRRSGDTMQAFRVSQGHGYITAVEVSFRDLYRGHAARIAADVNNRAKQIEMRQAA